MVIMVTVVTIVTIVTLVTIVTIYNNTCYIAGDRQYMCDNIDVCSREISMDRNELYNFCEEQGNYPVFLV